MPLPIAYLDVLAPFSQERMRAAAGDRAEVRFAPSGDLEAQRETLGEAQYAFVHRPSIPVEILRDAPNLRLVVKWGSGIDGMPLDAFREHGIGLARCVDVNAPVVADTTIALMLNALRRFPQVEADLRAGKWDTSDLWPKARDLYRAEVGLVGFGAIGQAVARRLVGFDCTIRYTRASGPIEGSPYDYAELDDLLENSDVVSLHLPLSAETRGIISRERIARMRPGAVLINTARGGVVDEIALAEALASGHLRAAGIDAYSVEPVPLDHPLMQLDNVTALPHIGGRTLDGLDRMARFAVDACLDHAAGRPLAKGALVVPRRG